MKDKEGEDGGREGKRKTKNRIKGRRQYRGKTKMGKGEIGKEKQKENRDRQFIFRIHYYKIINNQGD